MEKHSNSTLGKTTLILTFAALVTYIVGMASPHWLTQSFLVPNPSGPSLPADSDMGLFTACKKLHYPPQMGGTQEDCSSDGASDWQWVAAAFGIFGLVMGAASLLCGTLMMVASRVRGSKKLQGLSALLDVLAAGGMTVSLILYALNTTFVVDPRIPNFKVTFDISWAFIVSAVAAGMFVLVFVLSIVDLITNKNNDVDITDSHMTYSSKRESVSVIRHAAS